MAEESEEMGPVAETAVFAQWLHSNIDLHYARWGSGEVDIVHLDGRQKPHWCVEVKWSDRYVRRPGELGSLIDFASRHPGVTPLVTTRTLMKRTVPRPGEGRLDFIPTSLYCYMVGHRVVRDPSADATWEVTVGG